MATKVKWIENKTPIDIAIKYFVEFYHSGFKDLQDAKKYYFEMIDQNAFDNMLNKRSRHEAYKDVLVKHRDLWSKGYGQGVNEHSIFAVTNNVSNSKIKRNTIQGNRVDYSIDRLNKSGHIDLANKVIAKEISANAAMIQVGFRKPTITVKQETDDFIRVIKNIFTPEQINYICEKITNKS